MVRAMEASGRKIGTPLGEFLRGRRHAAGLTQRGLADAAELSVGVVRDLEQGISARLHRGSVERLTAVLGVTTAESPSVIVASEGPADPDRGSGGVLSLRVLGPLAAWRDGVPVSLGGSKQRTVLGLLAVHPDAVVSQDAIGEVLWGGDLPPTAATMIQSHVSRLRNALDPQRSARGGGGGGGLLQAAGVGYRMQPNGVELDLLAFRRLAEDARAARRAADAAGACELFERALGLWRGEPLADVALLRGHPAVVGLAERRAEVVVEYADTASAAGWPDQVLPHLLSLASRDPLNERAHACLMIALAAGGQQAAALEVYQQARRRLDDQLGVRPGAALAGAHTRVLQHDIPAAVADPRLAVSGSTVIRAESRDNGQRAQVCQLPPAVADFTGRAEQVARLQGMLGPDDDRAAVPVVVISGPPGVGKTALMLRAGHVIRPFFPDGQLWAQLDGASDRPRDPGDVLGELLRALGVHGSGIPGSTDERAALFRSRLADRRVLIVADDAASAAQVRPLLPGTYGCAVMVTSRRQLADLAGARHLPLGPLTAGEATELLGRIAGADRIAAESQATSELAAACGQLPLAVRIAGAKLAGRPSALVVRLAEAVADERHRLDALQVGDLSVRASLASGYQSLSEAARKAFRLLGLLGPCDVAEWVVAALLGMPDAGLVVNELCDRSMLTLAGTDLTGQARFRLHDLLRDYASEELEGEPEPEREAAMERAYIGWLQLASVASTRLPMEPYFPARNETTALAVIPAEVAVRLTAEPVAWFAAERLNLLAAVESACTAGRRAFAEQLATYQAAYHHIQDRHDDAERIWSRIAASAQRAGDGLAVAHAQVRLGAALLQRTYSAAALEVLDQCVQAFDATTNADALPMALYWRAVCAWDLDDFVKAQRDAERGVALAQQAGNRHAECMNLRSLAQTLVKLGHASEALRAGEQALIIASELGDESYLKVTLYNLAFVCAMAGQCERAVAICQRILGLCRKMGDARLEALALGVLGDAFHGLGQDQEAVDVLSKALPVFQEHAIPRFQALCMFKLGNAYRALDQQKEAIQYLERSLAIFRELRLDSFEERALLVLNACLARAGQVDDLAAESW
jgi:DNA-binding SARP family transcriptional activator/tetratricopeptide (TPR) repeat protein